MSYRVPTGFVHNRTRRYSQTTPLNFFFFKFFQISLFSCYYSVHQRTAEKRAAVDERMRRKHRKASQTTSSFFGFFEVPLWKKKYTGFKKFYVKTLWNLDCCLNCRTQRFRRHRGKKTRKVHVRFFYFFFCLFFSMMALKFFFICACDSSRPTRVPWSCMAAWVITCAMRFINVHTIPHP